jgi:hypothetical protein
MNGTSWKDGQTDMANITATFNVLQSARKFDGFSAEFFGGA